MIPRVNMVDAILADVFFDFLPFLIFFIYLVVQLYFFLILRQIPVSIVAVWSKNIKNKIIFFMEEK